MRLSRLVLVTCLFLVSLRIRDLLKRTGHEEVPFASMTDELRALREDMRRYEDRCDRFFEASLFAGTSAVGLGAFFGLRVAQYDATNDVIRFSVFFLLLAASSALLLCALQIVKERGDQMAGDAAVDAVSVY